MGEKLPHAVHIDQETNHPGRADAGPLPYSRRGLPDQRQF